MQSKTKIYWLKTSTYFFCPVAKSHNNFVTYEDIHIQSHFVDWTFEWTVESMHFSLGG
jgi:hypothetical protein